MARIKKVTVTIGRFGGRAKKIKVPAGTTIKKALEEAGFDVSSAEKIWVGGEKAKMRAKLQDNVTINVVGSYEGGL